LPSGALHFGIGSYPSTEELVHALPTPLANRPHLATHLQALITGYPGQIREFAASPDDKLYVILSNGSCHIYDDGKTKSAAQRLDAPDIKDMFFDAYPLANPTDTLPEDFDPGRARPEAFFKAIYGASAEEVSRSLVSVDFCGKKVSFTNRNGAADALKRVAADLTAIVSQHPESRIWVEKLGGTYNWRPIAGTDRLSMHSYGAAIDLNADRSDYWKWKAPGTVRTYSRKAFPAEIIEAFERHGFIWGGKWYHFDTMHFEYRPEVLWVSRAGPLQKSP